MKTMIVILSLFSAFGCGRPLGVPENLADEKSVPMDDATTPDLAQPACETLGEAQCESRSDCHSLYEPCPANRLCDVTPFLACANGAARCNRVHPAGRELGTHCPGVNMEWGDDGAGCVRRESCCTPRCGGSDSCTWCWVGFDCLEADSFC